MGPASLGTVLFEIEKAMVQQRQRQEPTHSLGAQPQRRWRRRASTARENAKPGWGPPSIAKIRSR